MWWRKKKNVDERQWTEGAALRIFRGYRFLQSHWVKWMERSVKGWSVRKQKIVLLVVMVSGTIYCMGLVYNGVKRKGMTVSVQQIETGEHVGSPKIDSTKLIR